MSLRPRPTWSERPLSTDHIDPALVQPGVLDRLRVDVLAYASGEQVQVPVLVARGASDGPVLGLTAAIHGNEINGIPVIHRLLRSFDPAHLRGTVIAVPVLNVPGFRAHTREFRGTVDLNRIMPGKADGAVGQRYANHLMERVVAPMDLLIDLHTASFGRINSLYVRADMRHPAVAEMARLLSPEIIVHNEATDGTLRDAAQDAGIPSVTLEVGNPNRFQRKMIREAHEGVLAIMARLGMVDEDEIDYQPRDEDAEDEPAIECGRSAWMYTNEGGLLDVEVDITERVRAGQRLGQLIGIDGDLLETYTAAHAGIIIGRATNPVGHSGARILHLGEIGGVPDLDPTLPSLDQWALD